MEPLFKIGDTLRIVDHFDESKIGREVAVINSFNHVRKTNARRMKNREINILISIAKKRRSVT